MDCFRGRTAKSKGPDVICGGTRKIFVKERYRRTRGVAL